jgi:uncharacterized protein (TIGR03437 family)
MLRAHWVLFLIAGLLAAHRLEAQRMISTVAGNGTIVSSSGDGGPATSAALGFPAGLAVDGSGNLYIADFLFDRVRKVDLATGVITAFAGGGAPGAIGDGGPATSATFVFPANAHIGLAADGNGNVYIADYGNNRVRKVSASGDISTVAGAGSLGNSGFSGDGGPATAAMLNSPSGVAVDAQGNLYIADTGNGRIRKVDTAGIISTVAGRGNGSTLGDGGPATSAQLANPSDVAVDGLGNLYIADVGNGKIRKVSPSGTISSPLTGGFGFCSLTPVPAASADIGRATGLAVDKANNLFIANQSANCIQELETNGTVGTIAGGGLTMNGENVSATTVALGNVWAVAVDSSGTIFLTDSSNGRVKKVTPSATPPSALPVITSIVNGANFLPGIAPNSWVTIRGRNFATLANTWDKSIIGGALPTTLDGVSVTIGGRPVYVNYISPTQINVMAGNIGLGVLQTVVTTPAGPSAAFSILSSSYSPSFFMWPANQPVATHADFSWAVKNGTFPGATTVAAKPGETIILWANGFGPTNPAAPEGIQVPAGAYTTTALPSITILTTPVTVYGAALAPGFAGLYQVAFQVPANFPDGDYPINGSIAGFQFLINASITVRR